MCTAIARTSIALLIAMLACAAAPAGASDRYDPRLRFRTTRTAHFDVHAHQGEEALARRLAAIAERVFREFAPTLGRPRGRVQIILVDQTDLANGWATPFPYDAIEITATPPPAASLIGNTTDWLELVFTHEYTHILHLDRTRGFMQGVRRVFGRVPVAFPNGLLPVWQIEGIATYEESRMTGEGRVPAADFRAIVDAAAARRRFEPIDRVSGGLTNWPGGQGDYAYGAYFHQFLADRYGPERIARLADATAGRIPLFGAGAFNTVFGKPLDQLWREFKDSREAAAVPSRAIDRRASRLTHHGFVVTAPRVAANGTIFYSIQNPDGFPALMRLDAGGRPARVAWRVAGTGTTVRGDWVVFDQVERTRSVAIFSDLYAVGTDGGTVHRLTRGARAADPDISPDGRTIVCTLQATGRRTLALLDFRPATTSAPRVLLNDDASDYGSPRWSPDGRTIVAERRQRGAFEIVAVDVASRQVRTLLSRADARLVTPSWTPDGRTILFSAAVGDEPFNVFALDTSSRAVRQVTDTAWGAQYPSLDHGTLTFVGYTQDGYDLFSVATDPAAWKAVDFESRKTADAATASADKTPESRAYSPIRTLLPTYWTPLIESDAGDTMIGASTSMSDALGRHGYTADAAWSGARARPDWRVSYAYDRWRPTLFAAYSDDTDPVRAGEVRTRELLTGALVRFRHLRFSDTLLGAFDAQTDTLACTRGCSPARSERNLRSLRAGWLHDSRREFGYSISSEEGFALQAAIEGSRTALGSDANANAALIDLRGFRRLRGHAVLAARVATATAWGDAGSRRVFSAAGPGPSNRVFDFGRDAVGLLRGFAPEDVVGAHAAVANLDIRFPIVRPQRGAGTWPLFLHSIHGAAFADAGHAWDSSFKAADIKSSFGAELSADLVVLHSVPLTLAAGAAWTRDPEADRRRGAVYARFGYAF